MFKNLTDFSHKRSRKEALGFYLAYFLAALILGGIGGAIVGVLSQPENAFDNGVKIGGIVSVVYSLLISGLLLKEKKLFKNFGYILLALLSGVLAILGGGLLGLIIPAFLTTKESLP